MTHVRFAPTAWTQRHTWRLTQPATSYRFPVAYDRTS
jgi:hypothetical protein